MTVLTKEQIAAKKEVLKTLANALCDLTSLQDDGVASEELYKGVVIEVANEAFDTHSYLVQLLPEPLNYC